MDEKELDALKAGATIMYETLNTIFLLHDMEELEGNEGMVEGCKHCSAIADAIVHYPCPTVQILLQDFQAGDPTEVDEEQPTDAEAPGHDQ